MTTAVIRSRDDGGRQVVGVPLSNRPGQHAWLYEADYEAIVTHHGHASWFVNDNGKGNLYVRLHSRTRGNLVMVARLIVADQLARCIRYRDGDRLNLRSKNLAVHRPPQRHSHPRRSGTSPARSSALLA